MHLCYRRITCNAPSFSLCRNIKIKVLRTIILSVVFTDVKISVTLKEKHFQNLIENRVLAKPFVPKPMAAIGA